MSRILCIANMRMVLAFAIVFCLTLVGSLNAQAKKQVVTSAPITIQAGQTARLMASNPGRKPLGVRLLFLRASDFSLMNVNDPATLLPKSTIYFDMNADEDELIIAAVVFDNDHIPAGGSTGENYFSLQVFDQEGRSLIFTDSF